MKKIANRYMESANRNHYNISPKLSEWLLSSFGENVEKKEPSCLIGGKINLFSYHGKEYGGSSKN